MASAPTRARGVNSQDAFKLLTEIQRLAAGRRPRNPGRGILERDSCVGRPPRRRSAMAWARGHDDFTARPVLPGDVGRVFSWGVARGRAGRVCSAGAARATCARLMQIRARRLTAPRLAETRCPMGGLHGYRRRGALGRCVLGSRRTTRRRCPQGESMYASLYNVRVATQQDADALRLLADLDSQSALTGRALIGEIGGSPAAALSLSDGRVIA